MAASLWDQCVIRARALAAEAGSLGDVGIDPDESWLGSAVGWLAEAAPSWEEMSGAVPTERSYRRLFAAPSLEAWLICWPAGGHLELHDHGGAAGALQVVEGALHERSLRGRQLTDGRVGPDTTELIDRAITAGGSVAFDGGYIHDVRNVTGPAATSVHVYGPARRAMAFYRMDGGIVRRVDLGRSRSLVEAEVAAEREGAAITPPSRRAAPDVAAVTVGSRRATGSAHPAGRR